MDDDLKSYLTSRPPQALGWLSGAADQQPAAAMHWRPSGVPVLIRSFGLARCADGCVDDVPW